MTESRITHHAPRTAHSGVPKLFLDRMAALLGDEYPAFLASYDAPASVGLRVNTLKVSAEAFRALAPFELSPIPWCPAGFEIRPESSDPSAAAVCAGRLRNGSRDLGRQAAPGTLRNGRQAAPGKHPYHAAGLYYLQDPSAMAAAELLDPRPGERVLDLAAAPGGKATHIASLMRDQGLLVANEIHPQRAWELAGNLERWGATNAAVTNETPERLAERFPGFFDRVLVDAPCSGEGMMRKGEAARREWAPELVRGCALRQAGILEHAARLVRPGGRLVYATCTFNPEENEGTIARFLADHPDFALIEPPRSPGFDPGRPDWAAVGAGLAPALTRAVRLWPHVAPGEGHFIAVLERASNAPTDPPPKPWRAAKLPRPVEEAYRAFCMTALRANTHSSGIEAVRQPSLGLAGLLPSGARPPDGSIPDTGLALALVGSYLYALPAGLPDLAGLRYLHPGRWLGTIKKDRFEPAHALALGLTLGDARRALDLPADASELAAYLRGETLTSTGEDGWTLVAVDGFPLGWGKRTGGRVKSHYPKGLRRSN